MRIKIIKWLVTIMVLTTFIFPGYLFTNGPTSLQKQQYPWLTDELYYYVNLYGNKEKLDKDFILAIIQSESNGKRTATSPVGAISYMQVMPFHNKDNPNALYHPALNIRIGCWYLAYCMRISKGDMIEALKNYNAGPASSFYNMPYIKEIMRNFMISKNIFPKAEQKLTWDVLIGMI